MAKFTIRSMGVDESRRKMDLIMQTISREGKYELSVRSKVEPEDLMANKLVQYKVLTRKFVRNHPRASDCYEYNEGENFAEANLKSAYKFVEQEKKRLNPSYLMNTWNKINNSTIISGAIGAVIGAFFGWLLS